ncbi:hypothetical protein BG015_010509 [Linnemannia schmuckeri]|uniref:Uncharacterized protein n=1 Tax=Linnemannia schmuckeri TaxID=64567 RepID=A0A9P5V909_9FUNG|nr:hypothetical protein BG015_010509 [Linnemannia schmuckeri]
MARLTKNMLECCHKLEVLTVKYVELDDNDLVTLLRGCRAGPGLVRLRLNVQRLSDAVTDAILAHSGTLQSVKIDIHVPNILDMKNGTLEELLSTLKSQPWGCKDLEFPELRIPVSSSSTQNNGDSSGEEDYTLRSKETQEEKEKNARDEEARFEAKGIRLSGMGWKVAKQKIYYYDGLAKEQGAGEVAGVLDVVEELKRVKTVCWNDVRYERLS